VRAHDFAHPAGIAVSTNGKKQYRKRCPEARFLRKEVNDKRADRGKVANKR
jgi:hypothetical protein